MNSNIKSKTKNIKLSAKDKLDPAQEGKKETNTVLQGEEVPPYYNPLVEHWNY